MAVEQFKPRHPPEVKNPMTAGEFNLWCAVHGKPYRMARHEWPDGAVEWDVEFNPGKPDATIAYGTGQEDETLAALAAFAFIAGVDWTEGQVPRPTEDETPAATTPEAAPAAAPAPSLYARAVAVALRVDRVTPGLLQDALGIPPERAVRLVERMEDEGIAGAPDGQGGRPVLVGTDRLPPHHGPTGRAAL